MNVSIRQHLFLMKIFPVMGRNALSMSLEHWKLLQGCGMNMSAHPVLTTLFFRIPRLYLDAGIMIDLCVGILKIMMPPLFAVILLCRGMRRHGEMNNSQEKELTMQLLKMNDVRVIKNCEFVLIHGLLMTTAQVNYRGDATASIFGIGLNTTVLFLSRSTQ